MRARIPAVFAALLPCLLPLAATAAQPAARGPAPAPASYSAETRQFFAFEPGTVALTSVRVIDGTGAAPLEGQTVVIENGRIAALGPKASVKIPAGARVLDRPDYTVLPGIVGMHDHLFDVPPRNDFSYWNFQPAPLTAPRLYLAHGVTSIRTAGTTAFNIDLGLKRAIDSGRAAGPRIALTSPLLVSESAAAGNYWGVRGPDDARRVVRFFADAGADFIKVYQWLTRAELAAIVDEAHKAGIKVMGHLCSITHAEGADLGIDSLEHGFSFMTDFVPGKKPDQCPMGGGGRPVEADEARFQELAAHLAGTGVSITSTIPLEAMFMRPPPATDEYLSYLTTDTRLAYAARRARNEPMFPGAPAGNGTEAIKREVGRLLAFTRAGGRLMLGPDAIGPDLIKGDADLLGVELLVEGGYQPLQAMKIASFNGAEFMGWLPETGSLAVGKRADLMLVRGNPAAKIGDIRQIELVFKDGVAYDPKKLKDSVRGQMGLR